MARAPRSVQIPDNEGGTHEYRIHLHPNGEGLALATDVLAIVGPSAGRGFFDAVRKMASDPSLRVGANATDEQRAEAAAKQQQAFSDVLGDLDAQALIQAAMNALVARGGLQGIAPRLLAYTFRDGVKLDTPGALDFAFTGNYGEQMRIMREVIDFNGFFEALYTLLG